MKGQYHDRLINSHGAMDHDFGWKANLIVHDCNRLLAALMKRQDGYSGILFFAIGEGQQEWDVSRPVPSPAASQLSREIFRRSISFDDILFLDENNQPTTSPTSRLEISIEISRDDFASSTFQSIREFGLFGGNATETQNSGLLVNHVIHPRIDISSELTLFRTLRLHFHQTAVQEEEVSLFGGHLPVHCLDGVGETFSNLLNGQGIHTLADLAAINPLSPVGNIPVVKLREFRSKARMVMNLNVRLSPFAELGGHNVSRILRERPEIIAGEITTHVVTADMAEELQEDLMSLQVAMDDSHLKSIVLADLMHGTDSDSNEI